MAVEDVLSLVLFQLFCSALCGLFVCAGMKVVCDRIFEPRGSGAVKLFLLVCIGFAVFNVLTSALHSGLRLYGWTE